MAYFLGLLYIHFSKSISNRKRFASNFIFVSMTTMLIITIVKSSLALSLGLVGALSIVRFRTALKDPEELSYLFLAIAIGLGMGANQEIVTIGAFAFIGFVIVLRSKFFKSSDQNVCLVIESKEQFDLEEILGIINEYAHGSKLKRITQNNDIHEISMDSNFKSLSNLNAAMGKLKEKHKDLSVNCFENDLSF